MMKCGDDCTPICDFCTNFRMYMEGEIPRDGTGLCLAHQADRDAIDSCDQFVCFNVQPRPGLRQEAQGLEPR